MAPEWAELVAGWPLAASLAVVTAGGLRAGRRRTALNEALHELRRPLQALALTDAAGSAPTLDGPLQMAAAALERLDREINGVAPADPRVRMCGRRLLEEAVGRWRARSVLAGGSLELRWRAGSAALSGDRAALAQALDNLIVNAIEHGGPRVWVEAGADGKRLRMAVCDSGGARRPARRRTPGELLARLSGRQRRGHGLRVVGRVAAEHGGEFVLRRSGAGATAVLELPLAEPEGLG